MRIADPTSLRCSWGPSATFRKPAPIYPGGDFPRGNARRAQAVEFSDRNENLIPLEKFSNLPFSQSRKLSKSTSHDHAISAGDPPFRLRDNRVRDMRKPPARRQRAACVVTKPR